VAGAKKLINRDALDRSFFSAMSSLPYVKLLSWEGLLDFIHALDALLKDENLQWLKDFERWFPIDKAAKDKRSEQTRPGRIQRLAEFLVEYNLELKYILKTANSGQKGKLEEYIKAIKADLHWCYSLEGNTFSSDEYSTDSFPDSTGDISYVCIPVGDERLQEGDETVVFKNLFGKTGRDSVPVGILVSGARPDPNGQNEDRSSAIISPTVSAVYSYRRIERAYRKFLWTRGTHYVAKVSMGGRRHEEKTTDKISKKDKQSQGRKLGLTGSFGLTGATNNPETGSATMHHLSSYKFKHCNDMFTKSQEECDAKEKEWETASSEAKEDEDSFNWLGKWMEAKLEEETESTVDLKEAGKMTADNAAGAKPDTTESEVETDTSMRKAEKMKTLSNGFLRWGLEKIGSGLGINVDKSKTVTESLTSNTVQNGDKDEKSIFGGLVEKGMADDDVAWIQSLHAPDNQGVGPIACSKNLKPVTDLVFEEMCNLNCDPYWMSDKWIELHIDKITGDFDVDRFQVDKSFIEWQQGIARVKDVDKDSATDPPNGGGFFLQVQDLSTRESIYRKQRIRQHPMDTSQSQAHEGRKQNTGGTKLRAHASRQDTSKLQEALRFPGDPANGENPKPANGEKSFNEAHREALAASNWEFVSHGGVSMDSRFSVRRFLDLQVHKMLSIVMGVQRVRLKKNFYRNSFYENAEKEYEQRILCHKLQEYNDRLRSLWSVLTGLSEDALMEARIVCPVDESCPCELSKSGHAKWDQRDDATCQEIKKRAAGIAATGTDPNKRLGTCDHKPAFKGKRFCKCHVGMNHGTCAIGTMCGDPSTPDSTEGSSSSSIIIMGAQVNAVATHSRNRLWKLGVVEWPHAAEVAIPDTDAATKNAALFNTLAEHKWQAMTCGYWSYARKKDVDGKKKKIS
jgi:hypothetical protein